MDDKSSNGWNEWKNLVLHELKQLNIKQEKMSDEMRQLSIDMNSVKAKSKLLGAAAGLLVAALGQLWHMLKH